MYSLEANWDGYVSLHVIIENGFLNRSLLYTNFVFVVFKLFYMYNYSILISLLLRILYHNFATMSMKLQTGRRNIYLQILTSKLEREKWPNSSSVLYCRKTLPVLIGWVFKVFQNSCSRDVEDKKFCQTGTDPTTSFV